MTSTDTQGISDEQIMEATREFAAEGGRWPSDWIAACRAVLALQPEAAMEEMRTAKQMSAEYLQGFEDGASHIPPPDCDQAFEEKYKTSSRDPSNEGELAIWRDAWAAKGADALAAIKAARVQALEEAIALIEACTPEEPNCVWEAAYRAVAEDHVGAIRRLLGEDAGRYGNA